MIHGLILEFHYCLFIFKYKSLFFFFFLISKESQTSHGRSLCLNCAKNRSTHSPQTHPLPRLYFKRPRLVQQQQRFCLWYKHTLSTNESHHDWWWSFLFSLFYLKDSHKRWRFQDRWTLRNAFERIVRLS